jgi:oligopeptide/dipeptide ABC transporter ATP-binding protein
VSRELVSTQKLTKFFPINQGAFGKPKGLVHALDGVTFSIYEGETLGLVGESGCGKSTFGRCIIRLIEPTSGEVIFDGVDITKLRHKDLRKLRLNMQMVFQNPFASLDPRMMIKDILAEPLKIHKIGKGSDAEERVLELLSMVGLTEDHLYRFAHEFSGGQRQRIAIARALALKPRFIVLDEPTSSLDVSVQAQILNLLKDLQRELKLTYLFVSHDLSVIEYMSDRVAVMYLGRIVEAASSRELFKEQKHPYARALVSAIPVPNPHVETDTMLLQGDPPSPVDLPKGCRFRPRCQIAQSICKESEPELKEVGNHLVACYFA